MSLTSRELAPDQNRTDTRSLEGYCSTIELQAQEGHNSSGSLDFTARVHEPYTFFSFGPSIGSRRFTRVSMSEMEVFPCDLLKRNRA